MANRKIKTDSVPARRLRSSPFTESEWAEIIAELELPPQQARIVRLVLEGMRNKQIAVALDLSESTVRTYLSRIFQRLNVADRLELTIRIFTTNRGICQRDDRQPGG